MCVYQKSYYLVLRHSLLYKAYSDVMHEKSIAWRIGVWSLKCYGRVCWERNPEGWREKKRKGDYKKKKNRVSFSATSSRGLHGASSSLSYTISPFVARVVYTVTYRSYTYTREKKKREDAISAIFTPSRKASLDVLAARFSNKPFAHSRYLSLCTFHIGIYK